MVQTKSRGIFKDWALDKLTNCERDFVWMFLSQGLQ